MRIQCLTWLFIDWQVNVTITQIWRKLFKALYLENCWKYKKNICSVKFCFFIKFNNI